MPRAGLLLAFAALLVLAGCIGASTDDLEEARTDDLDPLTSAGQLSFDPSPGPTSRVQTNTQTTVPDAAQGLFLDYELTRTDAGDVEAWLESPDGDRVPLASTSGARETTIDEHLLLAPEAGTWTLNVDASAPGELTFNTTMPQAASDLSPIETRGDTRPVVAVVDTGVNPYHEVFQQAGLATSELPERITDDGQPPLSVPLEPAATYRASLAGDADVWHQLPPQRLVHLAGTNVLGYQLDDTQLPQAPVLDRAGHGTSVAHAVVDEAPDATVVMVTGEDYDAGVEWAAHQDWIDLVSLSWGPAVNAAGVAEPHATGFTTPEATKAAHRAGQQVFAASGNDPTATITDTTTGPPWVHAVSGAQPDTNGRAAMSGNLVDTVANWTQELAHHESRNETRTGSGTSFATPRTAGVAAHVLGEVRERVGHEGGVSDGALVRSDELVVANADLRSALNRSAVYWNTTDYGGPTDPGPSVPVAPTPWVSMGWGYLDGSRASVAIDALLTGELPDKSAEAEAWMANHQQARETYWGTG
jgi:hypothetical protein